MNPAVTKKELTIRISGQAGQGTQTIGQALGLLYKSSGLHVFASQDYMSRVRGGNNFFQITVSGFPVYSQRFRVDILVALDKPSVPLHEAALNAEGILVRDLKNSEPGFKGKTVLDAPMAELGFKAGGSGIFANSVALGVIAGITGMGFRSVAEALGIIFRDKGKEVTERNAIAAREGFDFCAASGQQGLFKIEPGDPPGALLLTGNDAIALGAIRAGCKFYSAYPMTPSTEIMNTLANYSGKFDIAVEQAEDEIAAVNMAIGASFAGVRAMTGTSGGGFALMQEGVSLAGMTETPLVIFEGQRPAPATGFPTRTEQADLDFVISAGHGEFAKAVFSPGSAEEAFYLTVKAFNLAEKYQIPVIILSDQFLADSYRDVQPFDLSAAQARRSIISREDSQKIKDYKRYEINESGISPRGIPSWIGSPVYADSDEHNEYGHITEDAGLRVQMVEKRLYKKLAGLRKEIEPPVAMNAGSAETIFIGFGSTFGVLKEAGRILDDKRAGFVHLPQVWPFPTEELSSLLAKAKKVITVENNARGQLDRLIRRETGIKTNAPILKFDGRPFELETLAERLKQEL